MMFSIIPISSYFTEKSRKKDEQATPKIVTMMDGEGKVWFECHKGNLKLMHVSKKEYNYMWQYRNEGSFFGSKELIIDYLKKMEQEKIKDIRAKERIVLAEDELIELDMMLIEDD